MLCAVIIAEVYDYLALAITTLNWPFASTLPTGQWDRLTWVNFIQRVFNTGTQFQGARLILDDAAEAYSEFVIGFSVSLRAQLSESTKVEGKIEGISRQVGSPSLSLEGNTSGKQHRQLMIVTG